MNGYGFCTNPARIDQSSAFSGTFLDRRNLNRNATATIARHESSRETVTTAAGDGEVVMIIAKRLEYL